MSKLRFVGPVITSSIYTNILSAAWRGVGDVDDEKIDSSSGCTCLLLSAFILTSLLATYLIAKQYARLSAKMEASNGKNQTLLFMYSSMGSSLPLSASSSTIMGGGAGDGGGLGGGGLGGGGLGRGGGGN